jgi:hypothetical protein
MNKVDHQKLKPNQNLKNSTPLKSSAEKLSSKKPPQALEKDQLKPEITSKAKELNQQVESPIESNSSSEMSEKAGSVAKSLAKVPVLPIVMPSAVASKKIESKINDKVDAPLHFIKKPAVLFIEGFSAFGISNGDGIEEMAENYPGAKKFNWTDHDEIIKEIKKHAPDQPLVLVGHSFGGDTAIEVANELNNIKNGFRSVDLLVSIDAVGMNKTIIPMNVKSNLNFFGEGILPFVHGDPTVARNTKYTDVTNELRSDLHSKMEDSPEVQYQIFEKINQTLGQHGQEDIFIEISEKNQIKEILEALKENL